MHNNRKLWDMLLTCAVAGLSLLLLNPMEFWMPTPAHLLLVAVLLVVVSIVAVLLWKQSARDEREELHQLLQTRAAYLATVGVLTAAIVVQSFAHAVDPWVVSALIVMLSTRLAVATFLEQTR